MLSKEEVKEIKEIDRKVAEVREVANRLKNEIRHGDLNTYSARSNEWQALFLDGL